MKKRIIYFCIFIILLGGAIVASQIFIRNQAQIQNREPENSIEQSNVLENEVNKETEDTNNTTTNKTNFDKILEEEEKRTYTIPEGSLLQQLKEQNLPVILYFGADYCPRCEQMKPIMESVKEKTQGRAVLEYVDKAEQTDIAKDYPIKLIPTQFFVNADGTPYNGEKIEEKGFIKYHDEQGNHTATSHIGAFTEEELMEILIEMGMEE